MTLIQRLRVLPRIIDLMHAQDALIVTQRNLIRNMQQQMDRQALSHFRELQGLTTAWLIHHETPEVDMRDDLAEFARDLSVHIARLEEHVV